MEDSLRAVIAFCEEHGIPCESVKAADETLIRTYQALIVGDIARARDLITELMERNAIA